MLNFNIYQSEMNHIEKGKVLYNKIIADLSEMKMKNITPTAIIIKSELDSVLNCFIDSLKLCTTQIFYSPREIILEGINLKIFRTYHPNAPDVEYLTKIEI